MYSNGPPIWKSCFLLLCLFFGKADIIRAIHTICVVDFNWINNSQSTSFSFIRLKQCSIMHKRFVILACLSCIYLIKVHTASEIRSYAVDSTSIIRLCPMGIDENTHTHKMGMLVCVDSYYMINLVIFGIWIIHWKTIEQSRPTTRRKKNGIKFSLFDWHAWLINIAQLRMFSYVITERVS